MAESVGSIYYEVDAHTDGLIKAEREVQSSAQKTQRELRKTDSAAKKLGGQFVATGKQAKTLDASLKKTSGGMADFSRKSGQAGIQIQQLVGQIQGGASPMLALSQQAADLGIVLGAPLLGAVAGITASIAGPFLASLFDADEASDKLASDMEVLNAVIKRGSDGVNALSDEYYELAKAQTAVAKAQLAVAMIEANQAVKNSRDQIMEAATAMNSWNTSIEDATEALDYFARRSLTGFDALRELDKFKAVGALSSFNDLNKAMDIATGRFKASRLQAFELLMAIRETKIRPSTEAFNRLSEITAEIAKRAGFANTEFNEFAKIVANAAKEGVFGAEAIKALEDALTGTVKASSEARDKFSEMVRELEFQKSLVGKTSEEIAVMTAQQRLGKNATKAQREEIARLVSELYSMQNAIKMRGKGGPSAIFDFTVGMPSESELNQKLSALDSQLQTQEEKAKARRDQQRLDAELLHSQGLLSDSEFYEARRRISDQYYSSLKMQGQQAAEEQINANQMVQSSFESWGNSAANALTGVITGAQTGREAIQSLASSILTQAVGAIVQMGVQYALTNTVFESVDAARRVKNAALNTTAVTAQVAQTASLAAANAYAATAAIPVVGPAAAPASAAAAATAVSGLGAGAISAAPVAGARQYGGNVAAGSRYRVNEAGTEGFLTQMGGKQYLTPLSNGKVITADEMSGMNGGGINITVNNNAGVDVSTTQTGDRAIMIDIARREAAAIESRMTRQMASNTGSFYKAASIGTNIRGRSTR